jgi:hypothetical protein
VGNDAGTAGGALTPLTALGTLSVLAVRGAFAVDAACDVGCTTLGALTEHADSMVKVSPISTCKVFDLRLYIVYIPGIPVISS